jgi:hypothetical protein
MHVLEFRGTFDARVMEQYIGPYGLEHGLSHAVECEIRALEKVLEQARTAIPNVVTVGNILKYKDIVLQLYLTHDRVAQF